MGYTTDSTGVPSATHLYKNTSSGTHGSQSNWTYCDKTPSGFNLRVSKKICLQDNDDNENGE